MFKDSYFPADPPSTVTIVSMICIAMAGTLGLPFMVWLVFTGIFKHNWALVGASLSSGLICAGVLQSWKSVRSAMRQRRDGRCHSITITNQKFAYGKDDLVHEIPLADRLSVEDRVEPYVGSQVRSVKIAYRKADDSRNGLFINAMEFSKAWEKQGKFDALLVGAIGANQG